MTVFVPPCRYRREVVKIDAAGLPAVVDRCHHVDCTSFGGDVAPETCEACPLRSVIAPPPGPILDERAAIARNFGQPKVMADGSLVYERRAGDWEPPPPHHGYRPKSSDPRSDDAWMLVPVWPVCPFRQMANRVRECGCLRIVAVCTSKESGHEGQVDLATCLACPLVAQARARLETSIER